MTSLELEKRLWKFEARISMKQSTIYYMYIYIYILIYIYIYILYPHIHVYIIWVLCICHQKTWLIIPTHHPSSQLIIQRHPPLFLASNANAQTVPRHFYKRLHFDSVMSPATWRSKAEAAGFQVEHWEDLSHLAEEDGWEVINLPTSKPNKMAMDLMIKLKNTNGFPWFFKAGLWNP